MTKSNLRKNSTDCSGIKSTVKLIAVALARSTRKKITTKALCPNHTSMAAKLRFKGKRLIYAILQSRIGYIYKIS